MILCLSIQRTLAINGAGRDLSLGGPNGLLPLSHHNRAITDNFEIRSHELKIIPGTCRITDNQISLMSFKDRVFYFRDSCQSCRGCQNGAFGKRSFCLGVTHHFRRFPGSEQQNPLFFFLWVEWTIRIFADFRQNHLFSAGDKDTVFQNAHFDNPEVVLARKTSLRLHFRF